MPQTNSNDFQAAVLDYIRNSNAGGEKVGIGALSISSKQKGNEDLANALLDLKKDEASNSFDDLNVVGKKLLSQVEKLTADSIMANSQEQRRSLNQLQVLKKMLPLVKSGTDEQKKSKQKLTLLVEKTEKGLKKNASFGNRFVDFAKSALPSAAGIASGVAARSPLLGAVVNFALEKYQERQEEIRDAEQQNVQNLIDSFEAIAEEEAQKARAAERATEKQKMAEEEARAEKTIEKVEEITDNSNEQLATLNAIFLTVERIRGALTGEDELSVLVNELHEGIREGMVESFMELQDFLEKDIANGGLVEVMEEMFPSQEEKNEEAAQMELQTEALQDMAKNVKLNNEILQTQEKSAKGGGILSMLKDSVLGALGLGAVGGAAGGILAKFGGFFKMLKSMARMIPGVGFLKGALGKLFSFPVQFVIAVVNGLKRGISSLMRGEGIGKAALETISGFANWLLAGTLETIQRMVSMAGIFDPIFRHVERIIGAVTGAFEAVWNGIKWISNQITETIADPIGKIVEIRDYVSNWFDAAVTTAADIMENPGAFFTTKFQQIKEAILSFWVGMLPEWVPTDAFPSSMKSVIQKHRYGSGSAGDEKRQEAPRFADNIVDQARPALANLFERVLGVSKVESVGTGRGGGGGGGRDSSVIDDIIRREGGFVNDPNDRGGATNFGITQNTLSDYLGRKASVDEVKNLDEGTAREIYSKNYVKPFEGVEDKSQREFLIDSGVNHGVGRAKEWLKEVEGMDQKSAMKYLVERRRKFYHGIVQNDPSQGKFLRGWMNRLAEFDKPEAVASNENRVEAISQVGQKVDRQEKLMATKASSSGATVVSNTVNQSNSSNSVVQKSSPVNPDPTFHRYAGAMV